MSHNDFSTLPLNDALVANLVGLGYQSMTAIQAQSLPPILAGKDVIAQGKTGSGKTAAFGLGLLHHLDVKQFRIQALVLCPTRELADQVASEIRKLARAIHNIKVLTLCGGMPFGPQVGSLEHGAHIIVGTPGRVDDHLRRGTLQLNHLRTLVLDEADRMLDMGFSEVIDGIIQQTPASRQTLMFSATFPAEIEAIARRVMQNPERVEVKAGHTPLSISQQFFLVADDTQRRQAVQLLIQQYRPASAVVFCNTKRETQDLAQALSGRGFSALALHGDLEQKDRDQAMVRFANKSATVLVATDVAARGLDVEALDLVINYHLAFEPEVHVHRVGRTGRAGNQGVACTLFSAKESHRLMALEEKLGIEVAESPLPDAELLRQPPYSAEMVTVQIDGGKRQKLRPGDIVGALTRDKALEGDQVGKIQVFEDWAFVAVPPAKAQVALKQLGHSIKGKRFRARLITS
ncbi:MAG: ATP-dependent RNA helicase DbpA [Pseudomonadota bacterium]|uniref:ATP-dependent RNA helicase DbpA n=1 Tax=Gallaecimonas pentaromativorans TaxID=584787 RepID=UPI00067F45E9|nr:ATP-dependent RNA helicase DbpA [Gallaecimonas pentaromativorans]MED5523464.1 ATP-dependent RNA helicase DbpA [Pseudomonadota bacterium]